MLTGCYTDNVLVTHIRRFIELPGEFFVSYEQENIINTLSLKMSFLWVKLITTAIVPELIKLRIVLNKSLQLFFLVWQNFFSAQRGIIKKKKKIPSQLGYSGGFQVPLLHAAVEFPFRTKLSAQEYSIASRLLYKSLNGKILTFSSWGIGTVQNNARKKMKKKHYILTRWNTDV